MAELVTSLIKHCRATSALTALVPATRILEHLPADATLPCLAIQDTSPSADISRAAKDRQIDFWIKADDTKRSSIGTIRSQLMSMFQDRWGETVSSGGDAIAVVHSEHLSDGDGVHRPEADDCWLLVSSFQFIVPAGV